MPYRAYLSRHRLVVALICAAIIIQPALAGATEPGGAASPEEVVARLNKAAATEDFSELAACIAPEERAVMSMALFVGASMMVAMSSMGGMMGDMMGDMVEGMTEAMGGEMSDEDKAEMEAKKAEAMAESTAVAEALTAKLEAILKKHGLANLMEEEPTGEEPVDLAAAANELFADVDQGAFIADFLTFMGEEFEQEGDDGGMTSKFPQGELAGLTIEDDQAKGTIGDDEVNFVRVDGRWYLSLGDMMGGPGGS